MDKIIKLDSHRPPANQELLAQIRAEAEAADTPEARLLTELRGMEETLLAKHRQYVRLWETADQLGITPPVRTAAQIVADRDAVEEAAAREPRSWVAEALDRPYGELRALRAVFRDAEGRDAESDKA